MIVVTVTVPETRPLRQAVLRPSETIAQLTEHEPRDAFAAGAVVGEELIATGLIGPEGPPGSWRVRGMATAPAHRGRGAGSGVLAALLTHAAEHGATRVWCHARTPARSLYARAGFRVISDEFEPTGIGPHVVMELIVADGARAHRRGL